MSDYTIVVCPHQKIDGAAFYLEREVAGTYRVHVPDSLMNVDAIALALEDALSDLLEEKIPHACLWGGDVFSIRFFRPDGQEIGDDLSDKAEDRFAPGLVSVGPVRKVSPSTVWPDAARVSGPLTGDSLS